MSYVEHWYNERKHEIERGVLFSHGYAIYYYSDNKFYKRVAADQEARTYFPKEEINIDEIKQIWELEKYRIIKWLYGAEAKTEEEKEKVEEIVLITEDIIYYKKEE